MTEKLPNKCCAHCTHGRPVPDPQNLRTMIRCKAGPPSAQQVPVVNEAGVHLGNRISVIWPVLVANEECDAFTPKAMQAN